MTTVNLSGTKVSFETIEAHKRLGLILHSSDLTTEPDYARLIPLDQASFYSSRVKGDNPLTPENLAKMEHRLTVAAELFPEDYPPAAICYSCTSASVIIGDQVISDMIHKAWANVPVITPSYSAVQAFRALGIKRISILTPYLLETSQPMTGYFEEHGLEIQRFECFGVDDDRLMARILHSDIFEAACAIDTPASEAVFISCTALPAISVIADLEQKLGKPVVTSNQATAWAMLHYAGVTKKPSGYGRLFDYPYPA